MNKSIKNSLLVIFLAVVSCVSLAEEKPEEAPAINPDEMTQYLGYYYGYSFGNMLRDSLSTDVDMDELLQGLRDSLAEAPPVLTQMQREELYQEIRRRQQIVQAEKERAQRAMQEATAEEAAERLAAGAAYLAENAKREGIVVTESGLQYEVLKDEPGKTASASSRVSVKYTGTFMTGEMFDTSGDEVVTFGLQQVIPGWTEGLQLMSPGDRFRFYIHPQLAYGAGGVGKIQPNSVLIFDVELVSIN